MAGMTGLSLARAGMSSMRRGCRTCIETFPPICGYSYIRLRRLALLSDDPITCRGSFLAAGVCGGLWRINPLVLNERSGFPLRVSRFPPRLETRGVLCCGSDAPGGIERCSEKAVDVLELGLTSDSRTESRDQLPVLCRLEKSAHDSPARECSAARREPPETGQSAPDPAVPLPG
jgi:hypothetical protein